MADHRDEWCRGGCCLCAAHCRVQRKCSGCEGVRGAGGQCFWLLELGRRKVFCLLLRGHASSCPAVWKGNMHSISCRRPCYRRALQNGGSLEENLPVIMGLLLRLELDVSRPLCKGDPAIFSGLAEIRCHVQQVEMESNGKRVDMDGRVVPFTTGEILFGEPGTNGQPPSTGSSTRATSCRASSLASAKARAMSRDLGDVSNHEELMSNFFAQPDALACGLQVEDLEREGVPEKLRPHKEFPGNRPSMSLLLEKEDAFSLALSLPSTSTALPCRVLYGESILLISGEWSLGRSWRSASGVHLRLVTSTTFCSRRANSCGTLSRKSNDFFFFFFFFPPDFFFFLMRGEVGKEKKRRLPRQEEEGETQTGKPKPKNSKNNTTLCFLQERQDQPHGLRCAGKRTVWHRGGAAQEENAARRAGSGCNCRDNGDCNGDGCAGCSCEGRRRSLLKWWKTG